MSSDRLIKSLPNKKPLILKSRIVLNKDVLRNIKVLRTNTYHEDVIYESKLGDFLSGEYRKVTIVNRLGARTNACRTIAKCTTNTGVAIEKNSDEITKTIGQNNYDVLFSSLCSILSQELKVRGIWALLTVPKSVSNANNQTEPRKNRKNLKNCSNKDTQTDLATFVFPNKTTTNKRIKRKQLSPYVIKDEVKQPKKIVINPGDFSQLLQEDVISDNTSTVTELPELGLVFDEDSNSSIGKLSSFSISTPPEFMTNPMNILLTNVDKHTKTNTSDDLKMTVHGQTEPEKIYNLDTRTTFTPSQGNKEIPPVQKTKMLLHQGLNDWKTCLVPDNEGNLPIHVAILTNDLGLLKRQCFVFKMRDKSVDIPADGSTPLKMSLYQDNVELTSTLLEHGADVLDSDDEEKTPLHIAAEKTTEHLQILVNHCQNNARQILQNDEDLWKPEYVNMTDEQLKEILLRHVNRSFDEQGYTPLMLASKLGRYNNVKTLVESCKELIDVKTPNSGNTALYLAVSAACLDSIERGNKSKVVDHFYKTIEILVENGADVHLENFAGTSVNDLLTEHNIAEVSMLVANKISSVHLSHGSGYIKSSIKNCSEVMLFKDDEGNVSVTDFETTLKNKSRNVPKIIENVPMLFKDDEGNVSVTGFETTLKNKSRNVPKIIENIPFNLSPGKFLLAQKINVAGVSSIKKLPNLKNIAVNKTCVIKKAATKRKSTGELGPSTSKKKV